MDTKKFKEEVFEIEYNLMRLASNAMYDNWDVSTKALTKILEAVDKLKEARAEA